MGAEDIQPGVSQPSVAALARARSALNDAWEHMRIWCHGDPTVYAAAGQDAITLMNAAMSHLEHGRAALFEEIAAVKKMLADAEQHEPEVATYE